MMAEGTKKDDRSAKLRERLKAAKPAPFNILKAVTILTVISLAAAVSKITYFGYFRPAPSPESKRHTVTPGPAVAPSKARKHAELGDQQFKQAMIRLQDDLYSLSENQSEVVRQVNSKYPGLSRPCPLEWINGEAALSLDSGDQHMPRSLTSTVTQCAVAVEKYRDEKEAALQATDSSAQ